MVDTTKIFLGPQNPPYIISLASITMIQPEQHKLQPSSQSSSQRSLKDLPTKGVETSCLKKTISTQNGIKTRASTKTTKFFLVSYLHDDGIIYDVVSSSMIQYCGTIYFHFVSGKLTNKWSNGITFTFCSKSSLAAFALRHCYVFATFLTLNIFVLILCNSHFTAFSHWYLFFLYFHIFWSSVSFLTYQHGYLINEFPIDVRHPACNSNKFKVYSGHYVIWNLQNGRSYIMKSMFMVDYFYNCYWADIGRYSLFYVSFKVSQCLDIHLYPFYHAYQSLTICHRRIQWRVSIDQGKQCMSEEKRAYVLRRYFAVPVDLNDTTLSRKSN